MVDYRASGETHKARLDGLDAMHERRLLRVVVGEDRRPAAENEAHQYRHADEHDQHREQLLLVAPSRHVAEPARIDQHLHLENVFDAFDVLYPTIRQSSQVKFNNQLCGQSGRTAM